MKKLLTILTVVLFAGYLVGCAEQPGTAPDGNGNGHDAELGSPAEQPNLESDLPAGEDASAPTEPNPFEEAAPEGDAYSGPEVPSEAESDQPADENP